MTVFISYSHKDEEWKDRLTTQLGVLKEQGLLNFWDDRQIIVGENWYEKIQDAMNKATVAVLLISPDFLTSKFILGEEIRRLLQRRDEEGLAVFPIIIRSCPWSHVEWLSRMQVRPRDGKPLRNMSPNKRETELTNIAIEILNRVKNKGTNRLGEMSAAVMGSHLGEPYLPNSLPVEYVLRRSQNIDEDLLRILKEKLAPTGATSLYILAGKAGVGKTATAIEAVRALAPNYLNRIIWMDASNNENLNLPKMIDAIIRCLDPNGVPPAEEVNRELKARHMLKNSPTLIALDDFELIKPREQARCIEWLTNAGNRTVLLISRQAFLPNDTERRHDRELMDVMTFSEAEEFWIRLVKQSGLHKHVFNRKQPATVIKEYGQNPFILYKGVFTSVNTEAGWHAVDEMLSSPDGDVAKRVFWRSFGLDQVGEGGRAVLLALSLFKSNASRQALAHVAGLDSPEKFAASVRNLISLLLIWPASSEGYYTFDKANRKYAREYMSTHKLNPEFQERFVHHFADYVNSHAQTTADDFNAIEREKDNIFEALHLAQLRGDLRLLTSMYDVLGRQHNGFFEHRGYWDAALEFGNAAMDAARKLGDENMLARFTCVVAGLHMKKAEYLIAKELLQPLVHEGGKTIDKQSYVNALHFMGLLEFEQHNYERAKEFYGLELAACEKADGNEINPRGIANSTHELGRIARLQGNFDLARDLYERSLKIRRQLKNADGSDDLGAVKSSLHDLGLLMHQQGEWEEFHEENPIGAQQLYCTASSRYAEALRLKYKFKNYSSLAHTLTETADLARLRANHATSEQRRTHLYKKARARLATSLNIKERLYDQLHVAYSKYILGRVALDEGNLPEAQKLCDEALKIRVEYDDRAGIAGCRYLVGLIAEKGGAYDDAALFFGEALEVWKERGLIAAEYARKALARVSHANS